MLRIEVLEAVEHRRDREPFLAELDFDGAEISVVPADLDIALGVVAVPLLERLAVVANPENLDTALVDLAHDAGTERGAPPVHARRRRRVPGRVELGPLLIRRAADAFVDLIVIDIDSPPQQREDQVVRGQRGACL